MAELWLVRHGETAWTLTGQHTSRTDLPLTDAGREQARALVARLGDHDFARVLCSPLLRARETAELAGLGDLALRDDLCEWDYGEYEGRTTAEIREERPDWDLWRDGCPGGETAADVAARVDRVIADAVAADGDVACVAHGHVLRVLGARWIEQPPEHGRRLWLTTASLSVLGFEYGNRVLRQWNVA